MYRQWRRTMRGYKITRSYRDRFISGLFWRFVLGMTALLALEELTGQPSAAAQTLPDTLPIGVPAGESFMLLDEQPSSQMKIKQRKPIMLFSITAPSSMREPSAIRLARMVAPSMRVGGRNRAR